MIETITDEAGIKIVINTDEFGNKWIGNAAWTRYACVSWSGKNVGFTANQFGVSIEFDTREEAEAVALRFAAKGRRVLRGMTAMGVNNELFVL